MVLLNDLPVDHPLRNTPLGEVKALYRWRAASPSSPWRTVERGAPKLVKYTFNDLGNSWTAFDDWIVDEQTL